MLSRTPCARAAKGAIVVGMHENIGEHYANQFQQRNLLCLFGMEEALQASQIGADIGRSWQAPEAEPLLPATQQAEHTRALSEIEAKHQLEKSGVPIAVGMQADNLQQALASANNIGYPVVAKAIGLAHKTEHNAVRLNLHNDGQLTNAVTELFSLTPAVYIESMIVDNQLELIVGITRDLQLGLVLTLGYGGILVEIMKDSSTSCRYQPQRHRNGTEQPALRPLV